MPKPCRRKVLSTFWSGVKRQLVKAQVLPSPTLWSHMQEHPECLRRAWGKTSFLKGGPKLPVSRSWLKQDPKPHWALMCQG